MAVTARGNKCHLVRVEYHTQSPLALLCCLASLTRFFIFFFLGCLPFCDGGWGAKVGARPGWRPQHVGDFGAALVSLFFCVPQDIRPGPLWYKMIAQALPTVLKPVLRFVPKSASDILVTCLSHRYFYLNIVISRTNHFQYFSTWPMQASAASRTSS